jgi:phospholipase/carboxylesterase
MYTHSKNYKTTGTPIVNAKGALVMLHGRGGTAANIMSLSRELNIDDMAVYAPQANNNSWYPYSFMVADEQNQPALNSALQVVGDLVEEIIGNGIPADKIYFLGFSQGACLTLEYIIRNAQCFGGAVAFTGGLIGEKLKLQNYSGNFNSTPILITTSNPDPHVPLSRVEESVDVLKQHHAQVTVKVYAGKPHTIIQEEIDLANEVIFV